MKEIDEITGVFRDKFRIIEAAAPAPGSEWLSGFGMALSMGTTRIG